MSNQYRGHRSPDSQGHSNRQSDDFGTQERPRASFSRTGEEHDEFGRSPDGYAGRQQEMNAGHGSGSGRGYGRQASQGWDQDYGFGGRQSSEFGGRGGYTSQGYDRSRDASDLNRSQQHDYRTQQEFGGREGQDYDAYRRGGFGDDRGRQQDRGGWSGGQSGYGQRGGMGYGEQSAMGYGEADSRGGYDGNRNDGYAGGRQGGNRMYGESQQRGYAGDRPQSNYQQQDWGQHRESQTFSRGRDPNRGRQFGSPDGEQSGWQQTGPHAGRGPKGWRRSDERVTEDLCEALTRHPDIDATDIEVRVEHGEVTLTGTVDSREAKRCAEELAERCSGVTDVANQLRVKRDERFSGGPDMKARSNTPEVAGAVGSHRMNGHSARQESNLDTRATAGRDADSKMSGKD